MCDIPIHTVDATLKFINKNFGKEIDLILWTGDNVSHADWLIE